jgi:hypothetical protein
MGQVVFKLDDKIPKYKRQTQYLRKIENFLRPNEDGVSSDGSYTAGDILENGWCDDVIKKGKSEMEKASKWVDMDTIIPLPCFKALQTIYNNNNTSYCYAIVNSEDKKSELPIKGGGDDEDGTNDGEEHLGDGDGGDEDTSEETFVRRFKKKYPYVAENFFKPLYDAKNPTDALKEFREQSGIIALLSKHVPTEENSQNFDNLTFKDYFIPPMIWLLMSVDPSLQLEKVKEEIYELLPEGEEVTNEGVQKKLEELFEHMKSDLNHKKAFRELNERMKKFSKSASSKKVELGQRDGSREYGENLLSLSNKFSRLKPVNEDEDTANEFHNFIVGDFSRNLSKIPDAKLTVFDRLRNNEKTMDKSIRNRIFELAKSLNNNASRISSLKNDETDDETDKARKGIQSKLCEDDNQRLINYLLYDYDEIIERIMSNGFDTKDSIIGTLIKYIGNFFVYFQINNGAIPASPPIKFERRDDNNGRTQEPNGSRPSTPEPGKRSTETSGAGFRGKPDERAYPEDGDENRSFSPQGNVGGTNFSDRSTTLIKKKKIINNSGNTFNFYGNFGMGQIPEMPIMSGQMPMMPTMSAQMPGMPIMSGQMPGMPIMSGQIPMMMFMMNPVIMQAYIQQMMAMYGDFSQFGKGVRSPREDSDQNTALTNRQPNLLALTYDGAKTDDTAETVSERSADGSVSATIAPNPEDLPEAISNPKAGNNPPLSAAPEEALPKSAEPAQESEPASSKISPECQQLINKWVSGLRPVARLLALIASRGDSVDLKSTQMKDNAISKEVKDKISDLIKKGDEQLPLLKSGKTAIIAKPCYNTIEEELSNHIKRILTFIQDSKHYDAHYSEEQDTTDLHKLEGLLKDLPENEYKFTGKQVAYAKTLIESYNDAYPRAKDNPVFGDIYDDDANTFKHFFSNK